MPSSVTAALPAGEAMPSSVTAALPAALSPGTGCEPAAGGWGLRLGGFVSASA